MGKLFFKVSQGRRADGEVQDTRALPGEDEPDELHSERSRLEVWGSYQYGLYVAELRF